MPTITTEGNEEAQDKIQKDLNAYVETFLDSINNSDFGTVYEGEMSGVTSYEELSFQVIRADDKVISVVWGNEAIIRERMAGTYRITETIIRRQEKNYL